MACKLSVENALADPLVCELSHEGTKFSLAALGNSMECLQGDLPEWISPMERGGGFWRSGTEGLKLLLTAMISTGILVAIIAARFHSGCLLRVVLRWQTGPNPHPPQLALASSWLLLHMAYQMLLRGLIFLFLLSWDFYKCPPALSLASVCLRDGTFNHLLVIVLWGQLYFLSSKLECFTPSARRSVTREGPTRRPILDLLTLSLVLVLSSLSVLSQAMKSVPSFLGIGNFWCRMLDTCIGAIQGVLGSVVLSKLADKLPANRLPFLAITGLFTNCILPGATIVFLDTYCFGSWSAFWGPCRRGSEQFNRLVPPQGLLRHSIRVLSRAGICDPHQARALITPSTCIQVTLLRLQDVWLQKIIVSGLLIPASQLMKMKMPNKDCTQVVGVLAGLMGYAMVTAGHLPMMTPLLWLSMLSTECPNCAMQDARCYVNLAMPYHVMPPWKVCLN